MTDATAARQAQGEPAKTSRAQAPSTDVAREFGFTAKEARAAQVGATVGKAFRRFLFERKIPDLKRVGPLTEAVRPKFEALGSTSVSTPSTTA